MLLKTFFLNVGRRPRGTGFLKFTTTDAADAAVAAANPAPGLGIFLKGRQLKVLKALDKKSADDKALENSKKETEDQRNLYLAKVYLLAAISSRLVFEEGYMRGLSLLLMGYIFLKDFSLKS